MSNVNPNSAVVIDAVVEQPVAVSIEVEAAQASDLVVDTTVLTAAVAVAAGVDPSEIAVAVDVTVAFAEPAPAATDAPVAAAATTAPVAAAAPVAAPVAVAVAAPVAAPAAAPTSSSEVVVSEGHSADTMGVITTLVCAAVVTQLAASY